MQEKIETIIIGGTFNPVHIGHMHIADEAGIFKPEKIIMIPSYISAHKDKENIIDHKHRLKMLEIACRETDIIIDTCEIERRGVSYTIDTIRHLKNKYGLTEKPGLLIGDDLAVDFASWKEHEKIAEEAQLIIAYREYKDEIDFMYEHHRINNLMLNISSSEIRRRIASGEACKYLLPHGVYEYIKTNNLYEEE